MILQIEASTHREFHSAVSAVSEAMRGAGGWIVSHQFYSNALAMIAFQVPASALASLAVALETAQITLHQALPDAGARGSDVKAQLSITFLHDGPDLKRPVPAFG